MAISVEQIAELVSLGILSQGKADDALAELKRRESLLNDPIYRELDEAKTDFMRARVRYDELCGLHQVWITGNDLDKTFRDAFKKAIQRKTKQSPQEQAELVADFTSENKDALEEFTKKEFIEGTGVSSWDLFEKNHPKAIKKVMKGAVHQTRKGTGKPALLYAYTGKLETSVT